MWTAIGSLGEDSGEWKASAPGLSILLLLGPAWLIHSALFILGAARHIAFMPNLSNRSPSPGPVPSRPAPT
ncbi:hypothetical protein PGT21_036914 [Puccinia graminis f. sp. tritici]|uniref:Uncharacterized protein n=1 Tax=Puccinia graminis f. sp. tritici TaxID=56615 RepID=A0A5B0QD55_PUCGR|nr:hypothetical protein PGT21_036914 [Puccinia graminis f. sp. tritici]